MVFSPTLRRLYQKTQYDIGMPANLIIINLIECYLKKMNKYLNFEEMNLIGHLSKKIRNPSVHVNCLYLSEEEKIMFL